MPLLSPRLNTFEDSIFHFLINWTKNTEGGTISDFGFQISATTENQNIQYILRNKIRTYILDLSEIPHPTSELH